MIVIYAIVSRDVLLKHLRCRSFLDLGGKLIYQGLLTFWIRYKVLKGGRKFILARPHFGEYLALAIEHNRNAQRQRSPQARLSQVDPYFQDFSTACFSRPVFLTPQNQRSKTVFILHLACHPVEGLHGVNR